MIVLLILVYEIIQMGPHFQLQRQLIIQLLGLVLHQQCKHVHILVQADKYVMELQDVENRSMELVITLNHIIDVMMEIL